MTVFQKILDLASGERKPLMYSVAWNDSSATVRFGYTCMTLRCRSFETPAARDRFIRKNFSNDYRRIVWVR